MPSDDVVATLDPAITDPEGTAKERSEGRTSDPQFREEGTSVDDPDPDLTVGPKATDGGPERYPFPQAGDVEVALVNPGKGKGEVGPPLHEGMWVKLSSHESIPERHRGALAVVLDSPWFAAPIGAENVIHGFAYDPERRGFTVRVRDETDAILSLPGTADKDGYFARTGVMRGDVASHA